MHWLLLGCQPNTHSPAFLYVSTHCEEGFDTWLPWIVFETVYYWQGLSVHAWFASGLPSRILSACLFPRECCG
jgi:hypothetical protein